MEYVLSESEKKVHSVELEIFEKFKDICKKYNLKYFANAGTLIGAARHQGFIPWDDDIDVSMDWPDYKKLLEVAPLECQYPYFFQSHLTEECAEVDHVKIRRSDTTGFSKWEYENIKDPTHNMGIWIDIFPMFNIPPIGEVRDNRKAEILKLWRVIRGYNAFSCIEYGFTPNPGYVSYLDEYKEMSRHYSITEIKNMFLELCVYTEETGEIGETSFRTFDERFIYRKEWYENEIILPFEKTTIVCPEKYDDVLKKAYGDWRIPVFNSAVHEMEHVDTELSYIEYLKR